MGMIMGFRSCWRNSFFHQFKEDNIFIRPPPGVEEEFSNRIALGTNVERIVDMRRCFICSIRFQPDGIGLIERRIDTRTIPFHLPGDSPSKKDVGIRRER
jgi:hypothetical protein